MHMIMQQLLPKLVWGPAGFGVGHWRRGIIQLVALRAVCAAQDTDRDFFMGAEEAVEYGLIDAVISRPQLIAATNGASP